MSTDNKHLVIDAKKQQEFQVMVQRHLLITGYWHSCLNCEFWGANTHNPGNEPGCELADYQQPPSEVIVFGCPSWILEIPF